MLNGIIGKNQLKMHNRDNSSIIFMSYIYVELAVAHAYPRHC